MDTPLGLSYTPSFPSMQSLFSQMGQMRMLQAKQAQENAKTAETRAVQAVGDYAKFHPDRPYVKALEPYFQNQADQAFKLMNGVKSRTVNPEELYTHMVAMRSDADKAKRYDTEVTTFMNKWKDSGNYDMQRIQQMYANHTVDLNSTDVLGTVTMLPPSAVDPNNFVNSVIVDDTAYNKAALSEKFIAGLKKTEEDQMSTFDPAGNVVSKTTSLPSQFFNPDPGSAGQHTLNLGPIDGAQSRTLLARFRNMGPDWDNYLQLRTAKENPKFAEMRAGSKEWGVAMQTSLQGLMEENGYIGSKTTETASRPPSESDKTGTRLDATKIGGSAKEELRYMTEAAEYKKLFSKDPGERRDAFDMFYGKGVQSVEAFPNDANPTHIKIQLDVNDPAANPLMRMAPSDSKTDTKKGEILIPLDPKRLKSLSSYANVVRPQDLNPTYLRKAFDKLNEPTAEDIAAFNKKLAKLKPGDKIIGPDGVEYEVQENPKK